MRESQISIKPLISLFLPQNGVIDVWLWGILPNNVESAQSESRFSAALIKRLINKNVVCGFNNWLQKRLVTVGRSRICHPKSS